MSCNSRRPERFDIHGIESSVHRLTGVRNQFLRPVCNKTVEWTKADAAEKSARRIVKYIGIVFEDTR